MHRAHSLVPQGPCALASPDCHGDMRLSLHLDTATPDHLRSERDRNGTVQLFWVGPEDQIRDAYKWMCRYHSRQTHPNIRVAIEKAGRQGAALMAQMASQRRAAQPGTWAEYQRIHKTARNEPGFLDRCLAEDGTCKGRMEAALSPEAPLMYLRYVADNPDHPESDYSTRSVDYFPLCTSHHKRMDLGAESDQDQNHDTEQDTMSCRESPGTGSTDSQK